MTGFFSSGLQPCKVCKEKTSIANLSSFFLWMCYLSHGNVYLGFVLLKVNSKEDSEDVCGMISVQPAICGLFSSSVEEIPEGGTWQTMLKRAAYTIKAEDYPKGVFLTFLKLKDDETCGNDNKIAVMSHKSFEYQITDLVTGSLDVAVEIAVTVLLVFCTSGAFFIIAFCYLRKTHQPKDVK